MAETWARCRLGAPVARRSSPTLLSPAFPQGEPPPRPLVPAGEGGGGGEPLALLGDAADRNGSPETTGTSRPSVPSLGRERGRHETRSGSGGSRRCPEQTPPCRVRGDGGGGMVLVLGESAFHVCRVDCAGARVRLVSRHLKRRFGSCMRPNCSRGRAAAPCRSFA